MKMNINPQAKETVKALRAQLKAAFPGTKFSICCKAISGTTTATIEWADGPGWDDVFAIADLQADGESLDGLAGMPNPDYKFVTGINVVRCYREEV
jgi:hypothetical protein